MSPGPRRAEVAGWLRVEATGWGEVGSPFYAALGHLMADDLEAGGPVWDLLGAMSDAPFGEAYGLRLLGGVHRLVLGGGAPDLARHYASVGGDGDARAAWPAFLALVADPPPEVRDALTRPPQTNEVGRSAALTPGFLTVASLTGLPLRLLEIGASGGLNLRVDRYWYGQGGAGWGDPGSPVRLVDLWPDRTPPLDVPASIASRRGCDRDPIDASDPENALRLLSYVWPEQAHRRDVLRAALEVAATMPVTIDAASVDDWLPEQLAAPAEGVASVVFHSIVWQYLPEATRAAVLETLTDAGRRATPDAPLAYLHLEPNVEVFFPAELRLTLWPGPRFERRLLATSGFHIGPVHWRGEDESGEE
jgi:hypothetical protein